MKGVGEVCNLQQMAKDYYMLYVLFQNVKNYNFEFELVEEWNVSYITLSVTYCLIIVCMCIWYTDRSLLTYGKILSQNF